MQKKILVGILAGIMALTNAGAIPATALASSGKKYCGSDGFIEQSETITYDHKETVSYKIKTEIPNFTKQIQNANCANVAGTILIAYYDRMCEELIPNYKSYVQIANLIRYRPTTFETEAVMTELYSAMGTDIGGAGTTYNGFHNGMKSYVEKRNYNYVTEDFGGFNFEKYKASVESDKPVALFLDNYSFKLSSSQTIDNVDTVNSAYSSVAHISIGYGYEIDTYYDANSNVISTRTYLRIASGFFEYGLTYLCLDGKSVIDTATSVLIN